MGKIVELLKKNKATDVQETEVKEVVGMSREQAKAAFMQSFAEAKEEIAEKNAEKITKKRIKEENNARILEEYRSRKAEKKASKEAKKAEQDQTVEEPTEIIIEDETQDNPEGRYMPNFAQRDDNVIYPAFNMGSTYIYDEDGGMVEVSSSQLDSTISPESYVSNEDIMDMIIKDPDIKEAFPEITRNDIYVSNGLILMNLRRSDGEIETYRLDICGKQVYIQAPLEGAVPDLDTQIWYKYISVPTCSDLGKSILNNPNYIVDINDVHMDGVAIFRDSEDSI